MVPVRIRGVDYPSMTAAAKALGVTPSAIFRAIEAGTHDRVGLAPREGKRIPITIDGVEYRSLREAGKAFGLAAMTVKKRYGRSDT